MKYRVIFQWFDDEFEDCFEVYGLKELKLNIKTIKSEGLHKILEIYQVNKYGEYIPYKKIKF